MTAERPGKPREVVRLAAALLVRSMADAIGPQFVSVKDRWSARRWFASDDEQAFTFLWTCRVLNLEPGFVKEKMRKGELRWVGKKILSNCA